MWTKKIRDFSRYYYYFFGFVNIYVVEKMWKLIEFDWNEAHMKHENKRTIAGYLLKTLFLSYFILIRVNEHDLEFNYYCFW